MCRLSIFYIPSHSYLMAIFVKILVFCNFSKSLFKSKNYYNVNVVNLSNHLSAQKLPLFIFQKFIDCDWSKKHVTILNGGCFENRPDQWRNWLKQLSWGLKISYRQVAFLMLRPKLYRLATIILSYLKQLLIKFKKWDLFSVGRKKYHFVRKKHQIQLV